MKKRDTLCDVNNIRKRFAKALAGAVLAFTCLVFCLSGVDLKW